MQYCAVILTELESADKQHISKCKLFDTILDAEEWAMSVVLEIWQYPASAAYILYQILEEA